MRFSPDAIQRALAGQGPGQGPGQGRGQPPRWSTPALDQFGRDLSALAREGKIDPVIGDEALVAAAELSDRYITERFLPDKAIDLVDQAGARVRLRTKTPTADLRTAEREADQLQRDKEQAIANEDYGAPPGYVDYTEAGQLTGAVRRRPYSVVLLDEIIVFRQLGRDQLRQITGLLLEETRRKLHAQDITLEFAPEAVGWIAEHGYQPGFGARPMPRTIQREVDNRLSRLLLDGQLRPGQHITVGVAGGRLAFEASTGQPSPGQPSPGQPWPGDPALGDPLNPAS